MIKIAHRGNVEGKSHRENHPSYIKEALTRGYEVEVDVWFTFIEPIDDTGYFLGHDSPDHSIDLDFLFQKGLWIHCKDRITFDELSKHKELNIFQHTESAWKKGYPAITSYGYIWVYPEVYDATGNLHAMCKDDLRTFYNN